MSRRFEEFLLPWSSSESEDSDRPDDVFCTPENTKYYSEQQYNSLDRSKKEIRLIKVLLEDKTSSDEIQCELLQNIPLDQIRNKFTALSYCAGRAYVTKTLIVNGIQCNIFANLHHALLECRHFWKQQHPKEELLLWADQVCISQPNLEERAHQVGFMGDIYRAARQTLISLATKDCNSQGLDWLDWGVHRYDSLGDKRLVLRSLAAKYCNPRGFYWLDDAPHVRNDGSLGCLQPFDDAFFDGWLKFLEILKSPWWSRAWVFQEFMLSRQPIFLHGRRSMAWDDFDLKLAYIFGYLQDIEDVFFSSYETTPGSEKPSLEGFIKKNHQALEQVNRFLTRKDDFTSAENFRPTSDLKGLLFNSNYFEASDERDKIYAFLELTDIPHGIVPNYSPDNQVENMFLEITQKVITLENGIETLKYTWCCHERSGCSQSWVVPWTRLDCSKVEGLVFVPDRSLPENWHANASIEKVALTKHVALHVWGFQLRNGDLTWPATNDSDETWMLYGLKVPVFLRRVTMTALYGLKASFPQPSILWYSYFELIGPARFKITATKHFVDDMPQVFKKIEAGKVKRQSIYIL